MLEKISFKCELRHDLEVFYTLETIRQHLREKNRIHLYEDWHSRQETVKSCRLNPPVCKLLRFLFNFTVRIFVACSRNSSTCFSNCSLKLQALQSRDDIRVSASITNKIVIVKITLNVNKVQISGKKTSLFYVFLAYDF